MPWFPENAPMSTIITVVCCLLFLSIGPSLTEDNYREKRIAILGTTVIPAASVDLSQFNFTDLVNGMLSKALKGTRSFFSFLSVTSYSSFAFHKVSILIYNISNLKAVDYHKFPMRYCYCLNNRTNDLADYTLLLLDIIGNSSSSLKELFKSTSIVSVSQSNESDCIYFCVMTGRTGRNLSDLWDLTQKSPVVNLTFPQNFSSALDLDSILPNLITSAENTEFIMNIPTKLWTLSTSSSASDGDRAITKHFKGHYDPGHRLSSTTKTSVSPISRQKQDITLWPTQEIPSKGQNFLHSQLPLVMHGVVSKENKIFPTRSSSLVGTIAQKGQHQASDKISLYPHNALKEYSVSFLSQKTQDGSSMRLPGWTTIAALEMLQRPYTIMPLWPGHSLQGNINSVTERMPTPEGHFPSTQRGLPTRTSSTNVSRGNVDTVHTLVATLVKTISPSQYGTPVDMVPLRADSDIFDKQKDFTTKSLPWSQLTNGKKANDPSGTLSSLEARLPQVQPTMDGPRKSLYAYTQSQTTYAQESGVSPVLSELTDLPLRNINNFTFNGVFKNIEGVSSFLDCLGSHFTWLQVIFTNFPALLNFVSKLKCVTGLCPKDLEDYGCACRYELEGLPVDAADSCCFQHRKCYEEAQEMDCAWDPSQIVADASCLSKNITCESGHECEKLLCDCDKAAIECFVNTHINSSTKGMDIAFCPAPVTVFPETTVKKSEMMLDSKSQQNRSVDTPYVATEEGEQIGLQIDVTAFPSAEEIITPVTSAASGDTVISASGTPGDADSNITPADESTFQPSDITSTKSDLKLAEESTQDSAASPLSAATRSHAPESIEQVCDRFHFHKLKDDGNVMSELPLLGEMLYCLTGRCPEEFESYGCYCGHEGKGNPRDVLDSCCFSHQCCIEHLQRIGCLADKNIRSEVECVDQTPTCMGWSICDKLHCACDKAAAECMASAPLNATIRAVSRRQCQEEEQVLCSNAGGEEKPERTFGTHSVSSSSEESSEEDSPMRDIVRSGHSRSPLPRGGRRTRSLYLGN
ncbi:uncharacterized protein LOC134927169 isoform X2 [Pseudophryne corroboree]|uniref:uncharacterized protein LOC134927169 isoform X2 n=1 Tax=Pseudophryne corroboree TaxID=495146 RepID=UPI00308196AF